MNCPLVSKRFVLICHALVIPMLAWPATAYGQSTLSGIVREVGSSRPVAGAQIQIVERRLRTITGDDGRFTIDPIPLGTHTMRISRIGFQVYESEISIPDSNAVELTIELTAVALRLSEIVVTPGHFGVMEADVVAQQTLSREDIETLPQLGEDIFRAVQRLPGVASDDISTRLNVRGGTDQELLILLDDLELYEPYHLKDFDGALGIIDVNSIGGIDLVSGGFPVEHGDKLTGVFGMESRNPPISGIRTSLGLSITNASFMSQGGFGSGKGQWLVAGRRGYLDIALALTGGDDDLSPQYFDAFGKMRYQLSAQHRLGLNLLHAGDDLTLREVDGDEVFDITTGWNSSYGWLTWEAYPNSRITARTTGWLGRVTRRRFGFGEDPGRFRGPQRIDLDDDRVFEVGGGSHDLSIELSDLIMLKMGGELKQVAADYLYFNSTETLFVTPAGELAERPDTVSLDLNPDGYEASGYVAVRTRPIDALTAEIGVRYDHISHTDDDDVAPRFLAALELTPTTTLRASWGRYYQSHGIHELEVGDGEERFFPSDRADLIAAGIDQHLPNGIDLRVEFYRRRIADQRPRFLNADREILAFPEAEGDRVRIDPNRGRAHGMELLVSRDVGRRWAWSIGYVLAWAEDEIGGEWVPRTLDQRHTIGLHAAFRPNNSWRLSWSWQFHTGWPATPSTFTVDTLSDGSLQLLRGLGALNSERLPVYHRLDFRISRNFPLGGGVLQAYLDVFNVYNRTNLRSYFYFPQLGVNNQIFVQRGDGEDLLPILPSLGFRYEF